jgi:hypothetical protein
MSSSEEKEGNDLLEEPVFEEEEQDDLSEEPAFECNPEESALRTSSIVAHLSFMVRRVPCYRKKISWRFPMNLKKGVQRTEITWKRKRAGRRYPVNAKPLQIAGKVGERAPLFTARMRNFTCSHKGWNANLQFTISLRITRCTCYQ